MEYVQPIRERAMIAEMKDLLSKNPRNLLLFTLGINTGLRISDILELTFSDIIGKAHIEIREKKTGKAKRFKINGALRRAFEEYQKCYKCEDINQKMFDISRIQAYRIINRSARLVGLTDKIGTHTLRKTFGYHHYQQHKDVALLQNIFGHSSPSITLRYIGVNDDMMDASVDALDI